MQVPTVTGSSTSGFAAAVGGRDQETGSGGSPSSLLSGLDISNTISRQILFPDLEYAVGAAYTAAVRVFAA